MRTILIGIWSPRRNSDRVVQRITRKFGLSAEWLALCKKVCSNSNEVTSVPHDPCTILQCYMSTNTVNMYRYRRFFNKLVEWYDDRRIVNDLERSGRGLIDVLSRNFLEGLRNTTESLSQDSPRWLEPSIFLTAVSLNEDISHSALKKHGDGTWWSCAVLCFLFQLL
jgi:hypothetical protein